MQSKSSSHTRSRLFVIAGLNLILSLVAWAQPNQDMQNMPGMKSSSQKKSAATQKRQPAKKHNMANRPGMNMPGMSMSGMHKHTRRKKRTVRKRPSTTKHQMGNMPGMKMPGMKMPATQTSPTTKTSPRQMNMPGVKMPQASPSPSSSPQKMQMNMPGMQMRTASPNPQASPQQKMEMKMPMPSASPGASPQKMEMNMPVPGASPSPGAMENMSGMGPMNMGPLMVMTDTGMGVRVGSSEANVMDLGQMGSGTSWQPDTSPTYMMDKQAGNWLLMLHYNAVIGVNSQGGPRGATKFESANWSWTCPFRLT